MSDSKTIATAIKTAKDNPIDGTTEQVITLSISIAKSSNTMDKSVFNLYKEKVGISPKVFSKLKVIGDTLLAVSDEERKGMMTLQMSLLIFATIADEVFKVGENRATTLVLGRGPRA